MLILIWCVWIFYMNIGRNVLNHEVIQCRQLISREIIQQDTLYNMQHYCWQNIKKHARKWSNFWPHAPNDNLIIKNPCFNKMSPCQMFSGCGVGHLYSYSRQFVYTRWNSAFSDPIPMENGVKQGGVYCPRYFFVYILTNYWNVLSAQGLVAILVITSTEGWAMRTMWYY